VVLVLFVVTDQFRIKSDADSTVDEAISQLVIVDNMRTTRVVIFHLINVQKKKELQRKG
jgi:flagellar assembly factor FliW